MKTENMINQGTKYDLNNFATLNPRPPHCDLLSYLLKNGKMDK